MISAKKRKRALDESIVFCKLKEDGHKEDGDQLCHRVIAGNGLTCKINLSWHNVRTSWQHWILIT